MFGDKIPSRVLCTNLEIDEFLLNLFLPNTLKPPLIGDEFKLTDFMLLS